MHPADALEHQGGVRAQSTQTLATAALSDQIKNPYADRAWASHGSRALTSSRSEQVHGRLRGTLPVRVQGTAAAPSVPCGLSKEKHFDGGDALCPEITRLLETEPKINLIGRN